MTTIISAVTATGLLASCGASFDEARKNEDSQITNCGIKQDYPRPEKPVADDVSAVEKMFALGLAGEMRGVIMPRTVKSEIDRSPYKKDYAKVENLSDDLINKEMLVNAGADWIISGWQAGFSEESGVTPVSLHKQGINSYMQEETCFNFAGDGKNENNIREDNDKEPFSDPIGLLYRDLENLGAIFDKKNKADEWVSDLKQRGEKLKKAAEKKTKENDGKKPKVFVYDQGTDEPYSVGAVPR